MSVTFDEQDLEAVKYLIARRERITNPRLKGFVDYICKLLSERQDSKSS